MRSFVLFLLTFGLLAGANRGDEPFAVVDPATKGELTRFTSHRALVIGCSAYSAGWLPLKGVLEDLRQVVSALEGQGFSVSVVKDPNKQRMQDAIDGFVAESNDPSGRVVFWYSGHGQTVKNPQGGEIGYLVPVDAPRPDQDPTGFRRLSYPIQTIKVKAAELNCRHALFLFDSCFSGSLFAPMRGENSYLLDVVAKPVRMFITSGDAGEQVPDQSIFREEVVLALTEGQGDANRDGYVTGSELALHLKQRVTGRRGAAGGRQHPQCGTSEQTGLDQGDFVFKAPQRLAPAPQAPPPTNSQPSEIEQLIQRERQWQQWQQRMEEAYATALTNAGDASLSLSTRRLVWDSFLKSHTDDNPFSKRDDDLREKAKTAAGSLVESTAAPLPNNQPVPQPPSTPVVKTTESPQEPARQILPRYVSQQNLSGTLNSIGSDTLNNLMTYWSEGFAELHPKIRINIEGKGSSTAIPALLDGSAQVAPMSRELTDNEIDRFENKFGYKPMQIRVAIEALAIIVHKENPIQSLTLAQVDSIFSSSRKRGGRDISLWSDLGLDSWRGRQLSLYGRNSASGTYSFFKIAALNKGDFKSIVKEQPGSSAVALGVSYDLNGIGYTGLSYLNPGVKALALGSSPEAAVPPTAERIHNGDYPLARFYFLTINKHPGQPLENHLAEFLRFILSQQGQDIVVKDGYIPLTSDLAQQELARLRE